VSRSNTVWGIVPAAGVGSRMQTGLAKQYLQIAGKSIIEYTIDRLLGCRQLEKIVICVSPSDERFTELSIAQNSRLRIAHGGDTRALSVLNGLHSIADEAVNDDWVLVHDAARPCLSSERLHYLIEQLRGADVGGILALPAKDTLKLANRDEAVISKTLDRSQVWQAQTPQMFRYGLLEDCLRKALDNKVNITDEASALEWAGHSVKLIEGSASNIKVTTPEDLALAEFLLKEIE